MSWKKYGGTNKLDKINNISVNTVVTDKFTLKNFYVGDWDICGGLRAKDDTNLMRDLYVAGDIFGKGDINIDGSMNVLNTNIVGNVFIAENAFVRQNIFMDLSGGTMLHGENRRFGFGTVSPQATIDISGDLVRTIDIHTSTATNKNVIARNVTNKGVTVNVEPTRAYIDFYVDNSMNLATENYNGRLVYEQGGNFTIDVSNIVKFKPRVVFSQDLSKNLVADERVIIYGNPLADVPYIPTIYGDTTFKTGTAAYLVAGDNSSNVFFRLGTEKGSGLTLGGGYFPGNKIMGVVALTDASNTKYPAMNIISGNLTSNLKTSIAVNKYNVSTINGSNRYAMDVNGPMKLAHQELIVAADVTFQVYRTAFYGSIGYAVGSPLTANPYTQYFLKTVDGGYTWTQTRIVDSSGNPNPNSLEATPHFFSAIYAISESDILIAGDSRYFFRSTNGGQTWSTITFVASNDGINTTAIFLSNTHLIVGTGINSIGVGNGIILNSSSINSIPSTYIPTGLSAVNAIHGFDLDTVIVGVGGIVPYRTFISFVVAPVFGTRVATSSTFYDVKVFNNGINHVVAVGSGVIWYAHDLSWNGTDNYTVTWNQAASFSGVLRSVQVLDTLRAIAVGDNGLIMYSIDGYATWNTVSQGMLDNSSLITGINLSTISILNANDFVVSGTIQNFVSPNTLGQTKMFNLYAPYFLNRPNHSVLEASGNVVMSGDLQINDAGQLLSNMTSFNILPTVAQEINIGNTVVGGNTNVKANLDVTLNITGHQNMLLYGDASLNSKLFVGGDVSLNSNLFVKGDASLNSMLFVKGDASLNSNLFVKGNASLNSKLNVVGDASFNSRVFVGGDASLNSKLNVGGDVSFNSNLFVAGKTVIFDLSAQNADFTGIVRANTFDSRPGNSLLIGGTNAGNITIRTSTGSTNVLTLGDAGSNVQILGNLTLPGSVTSTNVNNLEIKNKTILLNDEVVGTNVSTFSGLQIRDDGVDNKGYFLTNGRSDGFLFKSSQNANRVNLDVSGLRLSNGLTQGFVVLTPTSSIDISADYTITTGLVNISDIQQLDASLNRRVERTSATTATTQVVGTNLLTNGLYVGKPVDNYIANSQMDISGNVFISRLGLGTSAVNANYTLEVNNNARISNNLDVSNSLTVQNNINLYGTIVQW
jgi:photosystem II stability/assembly factor-like uncharacterized protein/predicted acyltransferase (DUF342 family)